MWFTALLAGDHSNTSRTLALIFAFPPVGSANSLPQTKHFTLELAFPKMICSFLHLGHLTLTNLLVGFVLKRMTSPLTMISKISF